MKITKRIQGIGAAMLLAGGLTLGNGCAGHYAGGVEYYDYDYYPDADVYFYPRGHLYYWNEEGHWRSGGELPHHYDLRQHPAERFRGHSREPWNEHHEEHHGGH